MKSVNDIWHGDSRELCNRFKEGYISAIITDPPFGIDNLSRASVTVGGKQHARKIAGDDSVENALKLFNDVMQILLPKCKEEADVYVFTSMAVLKEWLFFCDDLFIPHGFKRKSILVWKKYGPGMGDVDCPWGNGVEFILFYRRGGRVLPGQRRENAVISFEQVHSSKLIHPHEKPIPLLEMLIKKSTLPGEFVVDPFGGSGSLVRASMACGRNSIAIEADEENYRRAVDALRAQEGALF